MAQKIQNGSAITLMFILWPSRQYIFYVQLSINSTKVYLYTETMLLFFITCLIILLFTMFIEVTQMFVCHCKSVATIWKLSFVLWKQCQGSNKTARERKNSLYRYVYVYVDYLQTLEIHSHTITHHQI